MEKKKPTTTRITRAFKAAGLAGLGLLASCANFNTFSVQEDVTLGLRAYEDVRSKEPLVTSGPALEHVLRVTERLVPAALVDAPSFAQEFPWETVLIQDDSTLNAFCLPGGKMAVYTGILAVTQDEAGLAVVMAHEIAHATARHGTPSHDTPIGLERRAGHAGRGAGGERAEPRILLGDRLHQRHSADPFLWAGRGARSGPGRPHHHGQGGL